MDIEVFTDNNPLVHLEYARLGAVEQRWVAQLANFNYRIKYRPGRTNVNADILSWLPGEQPRVAMFHAATGEGEAPTMMEVSSWRERQQRDPDLSQLTRWLEQGQKPSPLDLQGEGQQQL